MPTNGTHVSCGVGQFYSIAGYWSGRLKEMIAEYGQGGASYCGTIVFSDIQDSNGAVLAREIREAFPDTQLVSVKARNPNSGNLIETWLWTPNWEQVENYARDNKIPGIMRFKAFRAAQTRYGEVP